MTVSKAVCAAAYLVLGLPVGIASAGDQSLRNPIYIGAVTGDAEKDTLGYAAGGSARQAAPVILSDDARYVGTRTGDEERDTFARVVERLPTTTTASTLAP